MADPRRTVGPRLRANVRAGQRARGVEPRATSNPTNRDTRPTVKRDPGLKMRAEQEEARTRRLAGLSAPLVGRSALGMNSGRLPTPTTTTTTSRRRRKRSK